MKKLLYLLVAIIAFLFAITLYQKNPDLVTVRYYFGVEKEISIALLLLITFGVGALFGIVLTSFSVFKNKLRAGRKQKALDKVEKEVEALRAASVVSDRPAVSDNTASNSKEVAI